MVAAAQHDHGGPVRRALQLADHLLDLRVRPRGVIDAGNLGRFLVVCGPGVVFLVFEGGRVAGGGHDPSLVVNLDVINAELYAEVVPLPPFLPREGCRDSGGAVWVSLGDWRAAATGEIEGGASYGGGGRDGAWIVPEHSRARDLPDPVGDSSSAFSPASAALSTLPITP